MRAVRLWAPVALWCLLIFALSHLSNLDSGLGYDYPLRKAAHMVEFGVLWLLTRRALEGTLPGAPRSRTWPAVLGFCLLYAMSDEWHQTFVPTRVGCWSDVGIDGIGAGLACAATWLLRPGGAKPSGRVP